MIRPIAHEITGNVWTELSATDTDSALERAHSWPSTQERRIGRHAFGLGLEGCFALAGAALTLLISLAQIGGAL
jgi:hypothetical protein